MMHTVHITGAAGHVHPKPRPTPRPKPNRPTVKPTPNTCGSSQVPVLTRPMAIPTKKEKA